MVIEEEVMLINFGKDFLFFDALELFFLYFVLNRYSRVKFLREIHMEITPCFALFPLLNQIINPPYLSDNGFNRSFTFLTPVTLNLTSIIVIFIIFLKRHLDFIHRDGILFLNAKACLFSFSKQENKVCVLIEVLEDLGDVEELSLIEAVQHDLTSVTLGHDKGVPVIITVLIVLEEFTLDLSMERRIDAILVKDMAFLVCEFLSFN